MIEFFINCFSCKLFGSTLSSLSEGFKDWKHLAETLETIFLIEFSQRIQLSKTIDSHSQRITAAEISYWYEVVPQIVSTIKMLAQNCLALRDISDKLYDFST